MEDKLIKLINLNRYSEDSFFSKQDLIMVEEPLQINTVNMDGKVQPLSITMRTPGNDEELAIGFLFNESIIDIDDQATSEINWLGEVNVHLNKPKDTQTHARNFYMTSSCGVCGKSSIDALKINASTKEIKQQLNHTIISQFYELMNQQQAAFQSTGGCHGAGVFTYDGELVTLMEDVGRHNAVDKCAGFLYKNNLLEKNEYIMCLSGRSCFELIQKGVRMNCTTIISIGAATSLAVDTAKEFGITLIGFYKPYNFNIYTYKERII